MRLTLYKHDGPAARCAFVRLGLANCNRLSHRKAAGGSKGAAPESKHPCG